MSKWITKILALILICALIPSAYASESTPPADQISDNLSFSHYEWQNPARDGDFTITYVESGISAVSSGVYISGMTMASKSVTMVGGIASIQYWEDNAWKTYTQLSFQALQATKCELSRTVSVPGGFYYRLKITHTAEVGVDIVTKVSTTQAVYVN